jgi:hypothetical protein
LYVSIDETSNNARAGVTTGTPRPRNATGPKVDHAPLPAANAFNLYAQPASPNAFRLEAVAGTNRVVIDHPLVNGVRCAVIHATRIIPSTGSGTLDGFDIDYSSSDGIWGLFSTSAYPAGTAFNILIDPAQVFDCTDRIFANGFD